MYLGKRWVPMEVMDTILLLWSIAIVVMIALIVWLHRKSAARKTPKAPHSHGSRKKRHQRHRKH